MFARTPSVRAWFAGAAAALALASAAWFSGSATAQTGNQPERPQPLTIGQPAPDFTLTDMTGKQHKLSDYTKEGKIVVLEWFNPGCPFVVKFYNNELTTKPTQALAEKFKDQKVVWLLVNSTNANHADFAKNAPLVKEWNVTHPVLMDTDGKVGKAYSARTTPHMFIIHRDGTLAYQGAMDSNPRPAAANPGDQVVNYIDQALTQLVAGETVVTAETRPYGCSVKYAN